MSQFQRSGTITGTGATLNLELGFIPDKCTFINTTDGQSLTVLGEQWDLDTAQYGINEVAAGTKTVVTAVSAGISKYEPNAEDYASKGVTLGAAAGVNVDTEEIIWVAEHWEDPGQ